MLALLTVLGFVAAYVVANWSEIVEQIARLQWWQVGASLVFAIVGLGFAMLAWRSALASLGSTLPIPAAARVYFLGQLGKYVPGSVWPVLAQAEMAKVYGVSRTRAGVASLVHMLASLIVGCIFSAVCLLATSSTGFMQYWWLIPVAIGGLVVLIPGIFSRVLVLVAKTLRRPVEHGDIVVRGSSLLAAGCWFLLMWIAFGAHFVLLGASFINEPREVVVLAGAFSLAWVVGFVVVFVPAGAGVREATLVLVLTPVMTAPAALGIALVSRFVMLMGDAIVAGASVVAERAHEGSQQLIAEGRRNDPQSGPNDEQRRTSS